MAKTSAQPIHFDSGLTEYAIRSSMKACGPEISKMASDEMLTMNWWIRYYTHTHTCTSKMEDLLIANGKRSKISSHHQSSNRSVLVACPSKQTEKQRWRTEDFLLSSLMKCPGFPLPSVVGSHWKLKKHHGKWRLDCNGRVYFATFCTCATCVDILVIFGLDV